MNNHIQRIGYLEKQLTALKRVDKHGSHIGAGFTVELTVGKPNDESESITMEVCANTQELLNFFIKSVSDSIDLNRRWAKQDLDELIKFFEVKK